MPDGEQTVQNQEPVQEGQASPEQGAEPQDAAQDPAVDPKVQELLQKMVAEQTEKAVAEAKEAGRRELQSQQDRNKAELAKAERRVTLAEQALRATDDSLAKADPELAREVELARLRAERDGRSALDTEESTREQSEAYVKALRSSLESNLEALNIPKDDPRVDWADDAKDYLSGRARFDASVANIIKDNQQAAQTGLEKRLKDLENKLNETSNEANSVETTASTGAVSTPDAEFKAKFGAGDLPMTKENIDRYNKLLAQ